MFEFYKFWKCFGDCCNNEKVICIQTYQVFGWLKFRFQVDCLDHWNESKTMTNGRNIPCGYLKFRLHSYKNVSCMYVLLWITNGWNDELMTILEPFQELLWMQDSKCMNRVVMINCLPEMLYGRARWYKWYSYEARSI